MAGKTDRQGYPSPITTRDGGKILLIATNGEFKFWALAELVEITKEYRECMSLRKIKKFIADKKELAKGGECPKCKSMYARGLWGPYCGSGDYDVCPCCGDWYRELR